MKVTLEFDSEKDEEFQLYKTYVKAEDMSIALWDITQLLRNERKYPKEEISEETYKKIEELEQSVWDIINEYDLTHLIQ